MKKTKLALLSMTVVTTVFCLTMIFHIQLPFLSATKTGSNKDGSISTEASADDSDAQGGSIQSFSYQADNTGTTDMDSPIPSDGTNADQDTTTATLDNSPSEPLDKTEEASKDADGSAGNNLLPAETSSANEATNNDSAKASSEKTKQSTSDQKAADNTQADGIAGAKKKIEEKQEKAKYADIGISIAKDFVNIRKKPSTESDVLGKLYRNSAATILDKKGDWYYVESGSVTGYVSSDFIKTGIPDDELIEKYSKLEISVDVDGLNVRKEAATDSKKLTVIYKNEIYPVKKVDGDWILIHLEDENMSGYVKTEYADLIVKFQEAVSREEEQKIQQLQAEVRAKEETEVKYGDGFSYSDSDIKLLACLIHSEAGGQSYEGKLAVANVVLNRVKSSHYPDTIKEVIYQSGQFTVAASGSLQKQMSNYGSYCSKQQLLSIKAAKDALEGANNIGNRMHFNSYQAASSKGYTSNSGSLKLGDQLFW